MSASSLPEPVVVETSPEAPAPAAAPWPFAKRFLFAAMVLLFVLPNFPFPLSISSGDIGGPSAGLMWTLGLIDLLTPGDLTGGRKIAGTGEIGPDGKIYPIGGVQEKVVAAERSGAALFFAPRANASDARSVAHRMTIVTVGTYRDALRYLEQHR